MALDNITRLEAAATIPEDVATSIIQNLPATSVVLGNPLVTRRTMSQKTQRLPILSMLPSAYWVDPADNGAAEQTKQTWSNKFIEAEKLSVIVPIPKDVLADSSYDLWAEVQPRISEAIGAKFDAAVLFGTNAPASFPDGIVPGAIATGTHYVVDGSGDDIAADLNAAFGLVEADGFDVNGIAARLTLKSRLRGLRTSTGELVYQPPTVGIAGASSEAPSVYGEPVFYSQNGSWEPTFTAIVGRWNEVFVGIRQDMTAQVSTDATVGGVSLFETDQVALKVTFRAGWQIGNAPTRENENDATRFPFAIIGTD
jgi:HK97 family phage major capsid protein